MINWYYVYGSERVGPVGVETLRDLFSKEEINLETYVWKKGFQNWERLKDVKELDLSAPKVEVASPVVGGPPKKPEMKVETKHEIKHETKQQRKQDKAPSKAEEKVAVERAENSPEITFDFNWQTIGVEDAVFFIKIGHDRNQDENTALFGPYSLTELQEAIEEKRINDQTLLFTPGLPGWVKVGDTPLNPKNFSVNTNNIQDEIPLLLVVKHEPQPLIALVKEVSVGKFTLLGNGPFKTGTVALSSIYSGSTLKATNLKISIQEYRPREQVVFCNVLEMNEQARKIMLNYVN